MSSKSCFFVFISIVNMSKTQMYLLKKMIPEMLCCVCKCVSSTTFTLSNLKLVKVLKKS